MLKAALRLIATPGFLCERTTAPELNSCYLSPNLSPYAAYTSERWCATCIAKMALGGRLPPISETSPKIEIGKRFSIDGEIVPARAISGLGHTI
jgi:hypothetical protein